MENKHLKSYFAVVSLSFVKTYRGCSIAHMNVYTYPFNSRRDAMQEYLVLRDYSLCIR